jgi:hypothetical protein
VAEARHLWQVSGDLQREVDRVLEGTEATEWDENHLSFRVVQTIRYVLRGTRNIEAPTGILGINVEAYKITGAAEQSHGDIAIVVRHVFRHRREAVGLGFYEAKAADEYNKFPAFKLQQLQRLTTSTPRLAVLLYERHSAVASTDPFCVLPEEQERSWFAGDTQFVRARVVGSNLVLAAREPGAAANLYGEPFAYHLLSRYLSGRDLDYRKPVSQMLDKWLAVTKRSPPVVIALTVTQPAVEVVPLVLPGYEVLPPPTKPLITEPRGHSGAHTAPQLEVGFNDGND